MSHHELETGVRCGIPSSYVGVHSGKGTVILCRLYMLYSFIVTYFPQQFSISNMHVCATGKSRKARFDLNTAGSLKMYN